MISVDLDERGHAAHLLGTLFLEKIELQHQVLTLQQRVKYLEQFEPKDAKADPVSSTKL